MEKHPMKRSANGYNLINSMFRKIVNLTDIKVSASLRSKASHGTIMDVLEKYTGDDPATHLWNFHRGAHGRQNYHLHQRPDDDAPDPDGHDGT